MVCLNNQCRNFPAATKDSFGGSKGRLIKVAAALLTNRMSDCHEDYPKSVPKWVLRDIEKHNDFLRKMAIEIRSISDSI